MGIRYIELTPRQTAEPMKFFVAGVTARTAAGPVGVNRNAATAFFARLRAMIADHQDREQREAFDGEVEIGESYFGGHRKGRRGRRAGPGESRHSACLGGAARSTAK